MFPLDFQYLIQLELRDDERPVLVFGWCFPFGFLGLHFGHEGVGVDVFHLEHFLFDVRLLDFGFRFIVVSQLDHFDVQFVLQAFSRVLELFAERAQFGECLVGVEDAFLESFRLGFEFLRVNIDVFLDESVSDAQRD